MDERARNAASRFLSFVLRHEPQSIGIELDGGGWVAVDDLVAACCARGRALTREALEEIVAASPKRRFAFSEDGTRIRASQGHSVPVELGYPPVVPPAWLYHGTTAAKVAAIRRAGLRRMSRHDVHLSVDRETARAVGARRGRPVILRIAAGRMHADGHLFHRSDNGVWLTAAVPPVYIEPDADGGGE
jgi:putative RNA 2'-phosphotransferase